MSGTTTIHYAFRLRHFTVSVDCMTFVLDAPDLGNMGKGTDKNASFDNSHNIINNIIA